MNFLINKNTNPASLPFTTSATLQLGSILPICLGWAGLMSPPKRSAKRKNKWQWLVCFTWGSTESLNLVISWSYWIARHFYKRYACKLSEFLFRKTLGCMLSTLSFAQGLALTRPFTEILALKDAEIFYTSFFQKWFSAALALKQIRNRGSMR